MFWLGWIAGLVTGAGFALWLVFRGWKGPVG